MLTNKYAEGYPGKRYYGGCEFVDIAEELAIERAKQLFGAEHANVQPHSGAQANMAVYFAVLQPGDTMLGMDLAHGGHLTHGHPLNFSGKLFKVVPYGVDRETETHRLRRSCEQLAREHKPKLIVAGAQSPTRGSSTSRAFAQIADEVGALLMVDMAHIAGLVAAGLHPSPVPHCRLRHHHHAQDPARAARRHDPVHAPSWPKAIDSAVFPGIQGGPLMHVIAAKAVAFGEALQPEFERLPAADRRQRHRRWPRPAPAAASGSSPAAPTTTSCWSTCGPGLHRARRPSAGSDQADITVNKNTIPFDTRKPLIASGIRIGTPAVTTRGMGPDEMVAIAGLIDRVLRLDEDTEDPAKLAAFNAGIEAVKAEVHALTSRFPLY